MQAALPLPPVPTRAAGLARLRAFLPRAGAAYAGLRNHDLPGHPHVSGLSPWLRHRLLTEQEVIAAAAAAHGPRADKFVSEVLWRTYWKGWLELRPGVWAAYRQGVRAGLDRVAAEGGLRRAWRAACEGRTGIDAFDHWAGELIATGYLHNHARMWFASIWIFTLRLPWELGADFFLRHLLDGDPASNTLSWRWVAGLHTPGKHYLARAENIRRFTGGRFAPEGLDERAPAPPPPRHPAPGPAPQASDWRPQEPAALLLHEDDLAAEDLLAAGLAPAATAFLTAPGGRSPLAVAPAVGAFAAGACADTAARLKGRLGACRPEPLEPAALADWAAEAARGHGLRRLVTPHAPVGPVAEALSAAVPALARAGLQLVQVVRPWDAALWPGATAGFFPFREAAARAGLAGSGAARLPPA